MSRLHRIVKLIMSNFGVSIPKAGTYCVLVQPPMGLSKPGILYIQHLVTGDVWKCELLPGVLTAHISELGIPDTQLKSLDKDASPAVFNHKFVTENMIGAVSAGSFTLDDSRIDSRKIEISYTINAVPCKASLTAIPENNSTITTQVLANELLRCYDRMNEMTDIAKGHGVEFPSDKGPDVETLQKMQMAETRRRQFSAVNPNMRATKKVAKGFGSKAS
jgi:hypothetical protein